MLDITVSFGGTWHKRGFTSKYGIGICIEVMTRLVIDFETLSKYCRKCDMMKNKTKGDTETFDKWIRGRKSSCHRNYNGSSPGMEVTAAERIWRRSESLGFRYTTMVADGDCKTLAHINELRIYAYTQVEKIECLNHVAKRLGTGFRNLVKSYVGTETPMGGRGRGQLSVN